MGIDEAPVGAPGETATAVAGTQGAAEGRREDPRLAPDVDGGSGRVAEDGDHAGVAEEAPRRLSWDPRIIGPPLECRGVHVNQHLDRRTFGPVSPKSALGHGEEPIEARSRGLTTPHKIRNGPES